VRGIHRRILIRMKRLWLQAPTRADQEALAMALLASMNTARQHGTLGAVPAGIPLYTCRAHPSAFSLSA
jgi:hypothetical protein